MGGVAGVSSSRMSRRIVDLPRNAAASRYEVVRHVLRHFEVDPFAVRETVSDRDLRSLHPQLLRLVHLSLTDTAPLKFQTVRRRRGLPFTDYLCP